MSRDARILISSAGRRVELLRIWRETLAAMGLEGALLAADASQLSAAYHVADKAFQVPRCTSPDFVPAMLDLCRRERVTLVIPTIDTELPVFAAARAEFAGLGTVVHVSGPETIAIGYDKRRTHEWLVRHGFPTVRQAEATHALDGIADLDYPLIAKPVRGSSSVGVARISSAEQLRAHVEGGDYIIQSIAGGFEYTVDVLVDRTGVCRCAVPRRRLEVRAGEVSKGMTERHPGVIALASRIAEALPDAWGSLNVQMFFDPVTGALAVIELNPRFGGGFPLSWRAGAHYPRWVLEETLGVPPTWHDNWDDGVVMLRYDAAVYARRESCGL